jgi:hypothetical protein
MEGSDPAAARGAELEGMGSAKLGGAELAGMGSAARSSTSGGSVERGLATWRSAAAGVELDSMALSGAGLGGARLGGVGLDGAGLAGTVHWFFFFLIFLFD